MGPETIGAAAAQINLFVNTSLPPGPRLPTALRYAFLLIICRSEFLAIGGDSHDSELARQGAEGAHAAMTSTVSWPSG
jgi:hypothetical protein